MQVLLDAEGVQRALRRLAAELVQRAPQLDDLILIGIRRGGVPLAEQIAQYLNEMTGRQVSMGSVDITFYRDDVATRLPDPRIGPSQIPGQLDARHVVLVDDVLFTGRTVRAAIDALMDYGRPPRVELAVLVDRGGRELPIQADYVGIRTEVPPGQRVDVVPVMGHPCAVLRPEGSPSLPPPQEIDR
ncbi:MAG TPA: bifunctional pyr operon transcriptional regulator/uracil phosphoribosyltransferase PyrR [Polyangiaceae bacterium]|nr:bifunctional pyr operon transcriptional regulator/uracil phosphoribosyltransferase PyrR [Polyangiaceae bacterium]